MTSIPFLEPADFFTTSLVFILGLIVGSFLGAYTYRYPRGLSVTRGRSFCPKCKAKISWFDNIPLFSYIILGGRCRKCKSKISIRYPLIELFSGIIFVSIYLSFIKCGFATLKGLAFKGGEEYFQYLALSYLWLMASLLIAVFITDLENQLIPDEPVFILLASTIAFLLIFSPEDFYLRLFSGFFVASIFLFLNFITRGRGMGFGDAKLVLFSGVLDWRMILVWLFLSFIIGALVGIILILMGKARFGKQIAFGPFLVLAFFITLFWGETLAGLFLPNL